MSLKLKALAFREIRKFALFMSPFRGSMLMLLCVNIIMMMSFLNF